MLTIDLTRWLAAGLALLLYGLLCGMAWRTSRRLAMGPEEAAEGAWQIVFASQTGTAEELARRAAQALIEAGQTVSCCALNQLDAARLSAGGRFLFLLSTSGDGQAPDNAALFASRYLSACPQLQHLNYGLLALGDSRYPRFNAFGRCVDAWLQAAGAVPSFERIEVDRCDSLSLKCWHARISQLAGGEDFGLSGEADLPSWKLVERRLRNPGSQGGAVFSLRFIPLKEGRMDWQSGDIARVVAPGDDPYPRDYSIASLADSGFLELLVRQHVRADGTPGRVSRWLTEQLAVGEAVSLRIRSNPAFHLAGHAGPLLLVASGVGLAGVLAHLRARVAAGLTDNWLIFGERNAAHDFLHRDELLNYLAAGSLQRLDAVFSRDGDCCGYVQDALAASADELRSWVGRGAAIYVCGRRAGMGEGVDQLLAGVLGAEKLKVMIFSGAYRRDLF